MFLLLYNTKLYNHAVEIAFILADVNSHNTSETLVAEWRALKSDALFHEQQKQVVHRGIHQIRRPLFETPPKLAFRTW